jgi:hypothetical protein
VIPTLIIVVLVPVTARTIYDVQGATPPCRRGQCHGVRPPVWWEIRYPDPDFAANKLHVRRAAIEKNEVFLDS